jgi:hypothetical protein
MDIPRVTGFPFHPPADKRKGTVHVIAGLYMPIGRLVTAALAGRGAGA